MDEVDVLEVALSVGLGACFGLWKSVDIDGFFLGGLVMRRALLTDLLVSLCMRE